MRINTKLYSVKMCSLPSVNYMSLRLLFKTSPNITFCSLFCYCYCCYCLLSKDTTIRLPLELHTCGNSFQTGQDVVRPLEMCSKGSGLANKLDTHPGFTDSFFYFLWELPFGNIPQGLSAYQVRFSNECLSSGWQSCLPALHFGADFAADEPVTFTSDLITYFLAKRCLVNSFPGI